MLGTSVREMDAYLFAGKIPCFGLKIPYSPKILPDKLRRELREKSLQRRGFSLWNWLLVPWNCRIPCIFPCSQGTALETGSRVTASTTTHSSQTDNLEVDLKKAFSGAFIAPEMHVSGLCGDRPEAMASFAPRSLPPKIPFPAIWISVWKIVPLLEIFRASEKLLRVETEHRELLGPLRRRVTKPFDTDASG